MKTIQPVLLACGLLCLSNFSARAEHQVRLLGIADIPSQQIAFVEIKGRCLALNAGEREDGLAVLSIDLTNEIVKYTLDGAEHTISLPVPGHPATASHWIHFENMTIIDALDLFALLSGRNVMLHPNLNHMIFSCNASWPGPFPEKSAMAKCFSDWLKPQNVSALEDGKAFLQIIPSDLVSITKPAAKDLPAEKDASSDVSEPGMINWGGVDAYQIADIYGILIGRHSKSVGPISDFNIYFRTTQPISKAQFIYVVETYLKWGGNKILLNDDNTFSVVRDSR